jgi:hypothetical protein
MKFTELNIFGVYVAPIVPLMITAWIVTLLLRRWASRVGLLRRVWHPALFVFATYTIVLSTFILII